MDIGSNAGLGTLLRTNRIPTRQRGCIANPVRKDDPGVVPCAKWQQLSSVKNRLVFVAVPGDNTCDTKLVGSWKAEDNRTSRES